MNNREEKISIFALIAEENIKELDKEYLSLPSNSPELNTLEDISNNNATILHTAVFQNCEIIYDKIMKYLTKVLSNEEMTKFVNKPTTQGVMAIHYASFKGNIKIIKDLIEKGADKFAITKRKLNVMHYAAQGNQPNSLVFFRELYNMDISAKDNGGSTPLHWAAYAGAESALAYLLNWNADINSRDLEDFTPLHLAVVSKQLKIVKRLLQKGADVKPYGEKSPTPRKLAENKKYYSIAVVLKDSEKCQLCAFKAPVKKMTKSRMNIYIVFFIQIFTCLVLMFIMFPIMAEANETCRLNNIINYTYFILTFLFFAVYIYLIFSDSGVILPDKNFDYLKVLDSGMNLAEYCPKCKVKFNKRSKHCVICDKCVYNFDHHCYWVNNCIGGNNYFTFIVFLFLAVIDVGFLFGVSIFDFFQIAKKFGQGKLQKHCEMPYYIKITEISENFIPHNKAVIYGINILFLLLSLLFLTPVCLLCFCHSRNVCHKCKTKRRIIRNNVNESSNATETLISNETDANLSMTNFNESSK